MFLGAEHQKCIKFQRFLLEEFARLFKMFTNLGKKEIDGNEKLVRALEKCDCLEFELQKVREELAEYHAYDFDL